MSKRKIPKEDLPDEIIRDILSRLPVKSLLRCRCVSKHWMSIISDTEFTKSHLQNALTLSSHHRIMIPTSPLRSINYNAPLNDINASTVLNGSFLKPNTSIDILGSCNGLVCFADEYDTNEMFIYNPSTRRLILELPLRCSDDTEYVYGFGYGSDPNEMRVVSFRCWPRDAKSERGDLVDTNSSWISGEVVCKYEFMETVGTFLNGYLHWLAYNEKERRVIARFNVTEETFRDLSLPPQKSKYPYYALSVLQGCLSAVCHDIGHKNVELWMMKEYGVVNSWSKVIKIPVVPDIKNSPHIIPMRFVNDDEILLMIEIKSFVIFNAKKKTFRDVTSLRCLEWFGEAAVYVESLVSPQIKCVMY